MYTGKTAKNNTAEEIKIHHKKSYVKKKTVVASCHLIFLKEDINKLNR